MSQDDPYKGFALVVLLYLFFYLYATQKVEDDYILHKKLKKDKSYYYLIDAQ